MKFTALTVVVSNLFFVTLALPLAHYDVTTRHQQRDLDERNFLQFSRSLAYEDTEHQARFVDSILDERSLELELEARRGRGGIGDAAEFIIDVVKGIQSQIENDKSARSDFTSRTVGELANKQKDMNFVMCHTQHEKKFDGVEGKDWYHKHVEFDAKLGGTIGYEIYGFRSGEFKRKGDGGFLNWAYNGNVVKKSGDGKDLVFGKRG